VRQGEVAQTATREEKGLKRNKEGGRGGRYRPFREKGNSIAPHIGNDTLRRKKQEKEEENVNVRASKKWEWLKGRVKGRPSELKRR